MCKALIFFGRVITYFCLLIGVVSFWRGLWLLQDSWNIDPFWSLIFGCGSIVIFSGILWLIGEYDIPLRITGNPLGPEFDPKRSKEENYV